jgi:hypothetical protein
LKSADSVDVRRFLRSEHRITPAGVLTKAKVLPVAVMVPERQWSPEKTWQAPEMVMPEAVHKGPRSLMESGLSVSQAASEEAKIEGWLPPPEGVAHNGLVILK